MTTLVIIGNGFDIQNGLPTRYKDFKKLYKSALNKSLEYFPEFHNDQDWSYFEENLAVFDEESFRHDSALEPDFDDMVESPSYAYGYNDEIAEKTRELIDVIHSSFESWIRSIDVNRASKFMEFPKNCKFINFNYTQTLQKVYLCPDEDVLHIHGEARKNIIFGHGTGNGNNANSRPFNENQPWFEDAETHLASVTDKLYKPVNSILKRNREQITSYDNVLKVIVIGHSINEIDAPYFKLIIDTYPNATWENWNYGDGIKKSHNQLLSYGIPANQLTSLCSSDLCFYYPKL